MMLQVPHRYSNALIIFFIYQVTSVFIPERLSIVDHNPKFNNYLVRGNLPISSENKFQMKELDYELRRLTGLEEYKLVVISFLNFLTAKETKNRYIEQKYFQRHPQKGQYRNKLILGSLLDPFRYPSPISNFLYMFTNIVDIDDIDQLIQQLHDQIHGKGRNKIVFFHCSAGMDRTGYVAGSYKLKYLNYNFSSVMKQNVKFGRKYMHLNAYNGLKWFCFINKSDQQCVAEQ